MLPMSRRNPFVAPVLVATLMLTAAGSRGVREGQDVVGQKMPPLDFDRWLNTKNDKPLDAARSYLIGLRERAGPKGSSFGAG